MTTSAPPWTISTSAERIELDATGKAETTFTVTNSGPVDQRLVFGVVRSDNAGQVNVVVAEPQRTVPHGGSVTFLVNLTVPPGTPPATCWIAGRVYSAEGAPEETAVLSDRVSFEIKPTAAPAKRNIWIWLIPVIVLAVVVIGVVLFIVLRDDNPDPPPGPPVHASGELLVLDEGVFDLDELRASQRADADVQLFGASIEPERFFSPVNGIPMARLPVDSVDRRTACDTALQQQLLIGGVNLGDMDEGDIFCFRTTEGRLSVAQLTNKVSADESTLTFQVTTFE